MDLGNVELHSPVERIALAGNLLGRRHHRLGVAEVDRVGALLHLLDNAGDYVAFAVLVLIVDEVALGLADALDDHLLRRLRGDPAEV